MKNKYVIKFALKLWSVGAVISLLAFVFIPVEECVTYPIHMGLITLFAVTVGCGLGVLLYGK